MEPRPDRPRGSGPRGPLAAAVVVGGVLAVVALAALGSRSVDVPSGKVADTSQVAARFGVAVAIGLALCALVVALVAVLGRRDERVAASIGVTPWNTRRFLGRCLPWVVACVALAGVLGAATAPLRDKATETLRQPTGRASGDPQLDAQGDRADLRKPRYEGAIVRDQFGRTRVSVDLDGNGQLDATLVPCPSGSPGANVAPPTDRDSDGAVLVPIDEDCDGTIDAYARLRSLEAVDPGDAPLDGLGGGLNERAPSSRAAEPSGDRLTGGSVSWSRLALVLVVGLGVLLLAYAALRTLLKPPVPDEEAPTAAETDQTAAEADRSVHASMAILHRVSDPRDGIIAAYSQLLDGLAAAGLPRHPYEAPDEYMRRCSDRLGLRAEPLRRLTELFTVARFSTHELNEGHHGAALVALESVAADLAALRAAPVAAGVGASFAGGAGE